MVDLKENNSSNVSLELAIKRLKDAYDIHSRSRKLISPSVSYLKGTDINYDYLANTSELLSITSLEIIRCNNLTSIPILPNLTDLWCDWCNLTSIPILPNLTTLKIYQCEGLTSIPILPSLTTLDIKWCHSLTSIPILPNLLIYGVIGVV